MLYECFKMTCTYLKRMWFYIISVSSYTMILASMKVPTRLIHSYTEKACPGHTPSCNDSSYVHDSELFSELLPENQNHCCFCRCTDDCLHLGNCCPGKNRDVTSGISEEDNEELFPRGAACYGTFYSVSYQKFIRQVAEKAFMLVKTCDERFRGSEIREKCINASQLDIEEITPVYDSMGHVHYANRFCALCNYVETLENWSEYVLCDGIDLTSRKSARDLLMEITSTVGCAIWFTPRRNATECILDINVVNTCLYRSSAEECQSMPPNLYMSYGFVYKNLYCANCNHALGGTCLKESFSYPPPGITSLSALIKQFDSIEIKPVEVDPRLKYKKICGAHQIFSKLLNTCIQTVCPTFTERIDKRCEPVESPTGLTIEIQANIQYVTQKPDEKTMIQDIRESIVNNLPTNNVSVCSMKNLNETSEKQGHIYHYVMFVVLEEPVFMQTMYNSLIHALDILNNNMDTEFKVKLQYNSELAGNDRHGDISYLFNMHSDYGTLNCRQDAVAMAELQFCKTVRIPSSSFTYAGMNLTVNGTVFTYDEFAQRIDKNHDVKYAEICLDTFLSKSKQLANANHPVSSALGVRSAFRANGLLLLLMIRLQCLDSLLPSQ